MEIIASSLQKAGDFFLHAGYMSAAPQPGLEALAGFVMVFAGVCLVGLLALINAFFDRRRTKAIVDLVLISLLVYWLMGCGPPHGHGF